jgi:putative oxygen-independent coproporphyrinogen III oxidase
VARHLYAHLPFCSSRCGYCAFVVEVGQLDQRDRYLDALLTELSLRHADLHPIETVYLGGGTPTLMGADRLARILDVLGPSLSPGAEVTTEANPETIDGQLVARLGEAGINRLSIGVQSFQPALLDVLDRAARPEVCRRAVRTTQDAGIQSVSVDLIFGIPGQSLDDVQRDIDEVLELGPDHVSWYELELKPGSALAERPDVSLDDEASADAYERIVATLRAAGYDWYELANFARPGHECRHNLGYWHGADYVGIGVGAVGTMGGTRQRNRAGLQSYIAALEGGALPPASTEIIDSDTRRRERWMLGLRLAEPFDTALAGPPDHPEELARLTEIGLAEVDGAMLSLTERGRFLQNGVVGRLMDFA